MAKPPAASDTHPPAQRWVPESPLAQILSRSIYDRDFRARLIADPRATLEKEMGLVLPEKMQIKVVENTERKYTIALPAAAADTAGDADARSIRMAGACYVYHIPEHNFAVDLRLDKVTTKPGTRGFGDNPYPPTDPEPAS